MKISVITVCYNSARTIEHALRSVADQDFPLVEHIVIDGASKDDTLAIIGKHGQHVAKLVSERDRGIYDAMNKGVTLATGDVICFLNSDDRYVSSDVLSRVADLMSTHNLEALLGDVAFFREEAPDTVIRRFRSDRFTPARLAWGWMPAHPALFLRREVYERVGPFKTDYRIAGDFEFIVRAFGGAQVPRYRHLPEVLVNMMHGGASTGGLKAKITLNREFLRACRENGIETSMLKLLARYPLKLLELVKR
ncbi:glycosyltransferase family 2 protein [Pandoraea sp. PE-S2R-1]|uniref:glycosyltransferase family 2 protein n=1 Tax=Pandoraea sp. PE-S2R-1 TaxID=1986994 RepID=UPI000B4064DE|nr:glycosyltransferase family 2 protein [Pandoraea sp. PE-S2R-1]